MIRYRMSRLRDVADVRAGDPAPQDPQAFAADGPLFIRMKDVGRHHLHPALSDSLDRLDPGWLAKNRLRLFPKGSVLIPKSGASVNLNHRAKLATDAYVVSHLAVVTPKRSMIDPDYLYWWSVRFDPRAQAQVTSLPSLKLATLKDAAVPLPSLDEQRRIVDILNRAARIETLRRRAADRLNEFVPALFVKMFGDPIENRRGWGVSRLGDAIRGFQGGRNIVAGYGETRFRVLKVSAVTEGIFNPLMSKPVPDGYLAPDDHLVRAGDLLISRANTSRLVGATAIVEHAVPNVLLPDKIWRFVWRDDSAIEPVYMDGLFKHASVRAALSRMATGTSGSMKNISQSKLKTLPVPIPPLHLQRRFVEIVGAARAITHVGEANTRIGAILMSSLMSQMFQTDGLERSTPA